MLRDLTNTCLNKLWDLPSTAKGMRMLFLMVPFQSDECVFVAVFDCKL